MSNSTLSVRTTEVELGQFEAYLYRIGCDTSGRKVFTILLCIFIGFVMMFLMYILYKLIQNKPPTLYRITVLYFMVSFIYYISIILFILNQCYFHDLTLHNTAYIMITVGYTIGFEMFIGMLFWRLYYVFKNTAYAISSVTLYGFIIFQFLGFCPLTLFMFPAFFTFGRIGGVFMMVIGIPWVSGLYIHRLYSVVKAKEAANTLDVDLYDHLLAQTAKQTVLALLTVFGTVLILTVAFIGLVPTSDDWFWTNRLSYLCVVIDFATNILAFVLGYTYTQSIYEAVCLSMEMQCRKTFAQMVATGLGKELKLTTNNAMLSVQSETTLPGVDRITTPEPSSMPQPISSDEL